MRIGEMRLADLEACPRRARGWLHSDARIAFGHKGWSRSEWEEDETVLVVSEMHGITPRALEAISEMAWREMVGKGKC